MGVRVVERPLAGGRRGKYLHHDRTIILRPGMARFRGRSTFAHELGHAHYGHEPAHDQALHARQERLADEWAAKTLINPVDYALAEVMYGPHVGVLANHLEVTPKLVRVWRSLVLHDVPEAI
ncbi:ImmA/IrrE family metallo-endopeptidase [Rhodococcus rhodnii]|uniref:IrrE N-terminal-like domain-containing protein n=3 Tax=Rhodococcus rhodnii TaxID=38312 RepID=R7WIQ4_9NOCA|nr:hypothetical protein Rrhod_3577 [Rhodococcus rhodnii LMG 5362]TXG90656.1 ImmA/IrrE family metallo-endopeptidase [Rhodococcus rhodnii]